VPTTVGTTPGQVSAHSIAPGLQFGRLPFSSICAQIREAWQAEPARPTDLKLETHDLLTPEKGCGMTLTDDQHSATKKIRKSVPNRIVARSVDTAKCKSSDSQASAWAVFSKWSAAAPWRKKVFGLAVTLVILGGVCTAVPTIGGAIEYLFLKAQHPGAFNKSLPEELTSGVRVIERRSTLDLSDWKATNERDLQTGSKVSRGLSLTSFVVRKTVPGAKYFIHTVSSGSKTDPSIWCDSHPFRIIRANDQGSSGTHQWNVLVDISQEPDDVPFTVNLVVSFWNGFQKPSDWWSGFRVLHSTEKAIYRVVFPASLPAANIGFRYRDIAANQMVDLDPAKLAATLTPKGAATQEISWTVENPQPDRSYQVTWTWPESAATSH
jgi:hypothetical protein